MKKLYLINMRGVKEFYCMLVEKDIWDWLDYSGKNPCPQRLIDSMWEEISEEHEDQAEMVKYYAGCPPDERAPYVIEFAPYFSTITDLFKYTKKHKVEIVDEEDLAIY